MEATAARNHELAAPSRGFRVVYGRATWFCLGERSSESVYTRFDLKDMIEGTFPLVIELDADRNVSVLGVDGAKNVIVRAPDTKGGVSYTTRMTPEMSGESFLFVRYPQNRVNVVEIFDDGRVVMWEVAFVSQRGAYFITVQKQYGFFCYRDEDGRLACPDFIEKWPGLVGCLAGLAMNQVTSFPSLDRHSPDESEHDTCDLPRGQGVVLWYNLAQGLGAIRCPDGKVVRVHWSQVEADEKGLAYLMAGDFVTWKELRPIVSRPGRRPSAFKFEAVEVGLVSE